MTLTWILLGCAALLLALTLAPLSRRKEWWIRAWEFPRLQLAAACLVLSGASLFQVKAERPVTWLPAVVGLGCFIWQTVRILPFTRLWPVEVPRARSHDPARSLKIVISNVFMTNHQTGRLLDLIRAEDPDMVLTLESDAYWGDRLATLRPTYPHAVEMPLDNTFGMHFYSRFPIRSHSVNFLVQEDVPSFSIELELRDGSPVHLYCVHPAPPSPTENETSRERDAELVLIGRNAAKRRHPVLVAGDLNDVAWSRTTRRFLRISALQDPRVGRGFYNTFHARIPVVRWPLDHLFHSPDFRLVGLKRLPAIGSDHFPMMVELELRPSGRASA